MKIAVLILGVLLAGCSDPEEPKSIPELVDGVTFVIEEARETEVMFSGELKDGRTITVEVTKDSGELYQVSITPFPDEELDGWLEPMTQEEIDHWKPLMLDAIGRKRQQEINDDWSDTPIERRPEEFR